MGTRGLLGFIIRTRNRTVRRAVYNHYDSYPSGLGSKVAKFIGPLKDEEVKKMQEQLEKIEWVDNSQPPPPELLEKFISLGFHDQELVAQRQDLQERFVRVPKPQDQWIIYLRALQFGAVLLRILDGSVSHLVDEAEAQGSTWIEWSYWIDFWEKTVMVVGNDGVEKMKVGFKDVEEIPLYQDEDLEEGESER